MERRSGGRGELGRDAGTVHIAETFDEEDVGRLTGLFVAHWESDDDPRSIEGPDGVTVEKAIEWGREHSDAVIVRVGHRFYSAGAKDLTSDSGDEDDPDPILPWPEGGLTIAARPEQSALDGSEQVVLWRAHCRVAVDADTWAEAVPRLLADDLVVRVEEATEPGDTANIVVRGTGIKSTYMPLYGLIERTLLDLGIDGDAAVLDLRMESCDFRVFE